MNHIRERRLEITLACETAERKTREIKEEIEALILGTKRVKE